MRKTIIIAILTLAALSLATVAVLAQTTPASSVTGIAIISHPSADGTYAKGETISVQVSFGSPVTVSSGTPQLALTVGIATRQAIYSSGSGTEHLTFSYTVQAGDRDADGISIVQNSLQGNIFQTGTTFEASLQHTAITNASGQKVNGGPLNPPPTFPAAAIVAPQTYIKGITIASLLLPAATGTAPLTYTLTGPANAPQLPDGLVFNATTRALSGTPTGWQAAIRYTYTATDANRSTTSLPMDITINADFDADNDQLIEIHNLAQLNAIRWDLNGDGSVSSQATATRANYRAAYPGIAGMGCKSVDHDNNTTTPNQPVCIGYELNDNLDFDTDGDGATYTITSTSTGATAGDSGDQYYNGGQGWAPIGDKTNPFTATFDGNDKTIANLFINSAGANALADIGLFGAIGKCGTGGDCQGEVKNLGLLDAKVTRNHSARGEVGTLAGRLFGSVTACYADGGSVEHTFTGSGASTAGGLIGFVGDAGEVTGSYAKVNVTSTGVTRSVRTGGLVGRSSGTITASYAAGDVIKNGRGPTGGLVGYLPGEGSIIASYVSGSVSRGNGLAGVTPASTTITASYAIGTVSGAGLSGRSSVVSGSYWDIGGTGISATTSSGGTGKTTTQLQSPTSNTGIYAAWSADQWDFGTAHQYPAVKHNGKLVPGQRETSIRADNPAAPVVGEPVVAALNVTGATSTAWQWQSSAGGAAWTNIAGATSTTYLPATTDVGTHLRAKVTFTASGRSRTETTFNTAKVVAAPAATASEVSSFIPVVGEKIRLSLSAAGAANPSIWRWQRCNDAAMQTACKFVTSSEPTNNAYTEYTPTAGTDTDVGKYLQAYVYYANTGNSNAWTRGKTLVLGPVAAASSP